MELVIAIVLAIIIGVPIAIIFTIGESKIMSEGGNPFKRKK